jgi:adenylosuccinate lyase
MIARYTRPEIGAIWTDEARFGAMRDVEVAAAEALEGPTPDELDAIRAATFTVDAINEREKITDHDTAAFVDVLAASAGPAGRWIHYGLTSSDVVDTGLALQLKRAGEVILPAARQLAWELAEKAREHADTLCVGRTHGVHAEPTSFGLKLAGYAIEAHRNAQRLERAFAQAATAAISGAVGTYATLGPGYEERVLANLGLAAESISTQVVPRDRHAELLSAIALAGAGLERFATEIRHLQRTEVREVEEPFRAGQKGSSAMPHKRNPVVAERICGLARVLRGNAQVGIENVALWHERDISHSSAERIVLPDSTILLDQVLALALRIVRGMTVHADRMKANLELTSGALFSQRVLLALVAGGMQRDDAYRIVQRLAQQAWDTQTPLRRLLEQEDVALDLDEVFDYGYYVRFVPQALERLEVIPSPS